MTDVQLRPAFLEGERGRVFALLRQPARARAGVLIAPPFAEEMNKSRHLFTEVANRLAAQDVGVVIVDPFGTGDSAGEFADADWAVWRADLGTAAAWAESQGVRITSILGMRLGCALACEMIRERSLSLRRCVFWQPVLSGARAVDQFLRLRVAASMMQSEAKESVAGLRAALRTGATVEVAGYELTGRLTEQLDQVNLAAALHPGLGEVHWIELIRSADAAAPTPVLKAVEEATGAGLPIRLETIQGEPFWSSVELVRNTALVDRTVAALADPS